MSKIKILFLILIVIFVSLGLDVFVIEPNIIEISKLDISDTGTDMRIGFIADFQRQNSDPAFVNRAVDMLNEQDLDLVLIGGDFIHLDTSELPSLDALERLETRHGTFAVLGNHDYNVYSFSRHSPNLELAETIIEYLQNRDIKTLRNQSFAISGVTVVGLDSYWAGLRDESKASVNLPDGFKILLSHNQDALSIDGDTADLYLFGHTHCGQVRLPILGSVPKMMGFSGDYDYKHYIVNDANVYTTCGLTPGPRLLNPPEIVIITLS